MKILIIGSGGREHTIAWKLKQNPRVSSIYVAPGNGGTATDAINIDIKETDFDAIEAFVKEQLIDLVVVGPEVPLVMGLVDRLRPFVRVFGPNKQCAQLEGSKAFSKEFMQRHHIPTAAYADFADALSAKHYLEACDYPIVIKADGLAAGKGVVIAKDQAEAVKSIEDMMEARLFGDAGGKVVIEQFLVGEEASLLTFVDKSALIPMVSAQDHKTIFEGDKGPNTGGMGTYSPAPVMTPQVMNKVRSTILDRIQDGFRRDGLDFRGVLFIGLMIVKGEPYVLEFNVRFGDPETQSVLMRLESDLLSILEAVCDDKLSIMDIVWSNDPVVCVVLASGGYPGPFEKHKIITGLDKVTNQAFHAGTILSNDRVYTNGGRVLGVTARGKTLEEAISKAYADVDIIDFDGKYCRRDIGQKALHRPS